MITQEQRDAAREEYRRMRAEWRGAFPFILEIVPGPHSQVLVLQPDHGSHGNAHLHICSPTSPVYATILTQLHTLALPSERIAWALIEGTAGGLDDQFAAWCEAGDAERRRLKQSHIPIVTIPTHQDSDGYQYSGARQYEAIPLLPVLEEFQAQDRDMDSPTSYRLYCGSASLTLECDHATGGIAFHSFFPQPYGLDVRAADRLARDILTLTELAKRADVRAFSRMNARLAELRRIASP